MTNTTDLVKSCVGCGYCCIKTPCPLAYHVHGNDITECPSLVWNNDRYICKLALSEDKLGDEYRWQLHIGAGCCCGLNTWRKNVVPQREKDLSPFEGMGIPSEVLFATFIRNLMRQFCSSDLLWLAIHGMCYELLGTTRSKEEINDFTDKIVKWAKSNRPSFVNDFMG